MKITRVPICEAVFDRMIELGLDPETDFFEDVLAAVVDYVMQPVRWFGETNTLERAAVIKWHKIEAKNPDGQAREHQPSQEEIFVQWKKALIDQTGDDLSLTALLDELEEVAMLEKDIQELPKEDKNEDGISVGEGAGTGAESADGSEPTGDENGTCNGVADWGRAGTEAGAVEEECLDHGEEDEEAETDRILRALAFGSESECRDEMGISGEGSGEAPDETGCVEGRETCFGSLPPMSEYRTSLYAKGVFR